MQGRTTCWDLPSLLIKPVQRVLKYPLLLRVSKKTNALLFFVGMLVNYYCIRNSLLAHLKITQIMNNY